MKNFFRYTFLLAACGCLGSAATNVGSTDSYPLVRVDGNNIPVTLSDSTGNSVQVTHGTLTTYSYSVSCDYRVDLSNGKSLSGTKTCSLVSDVKVVSDGLEFSLDASEVGGPKGGHAYDFKTNIGKPCTCGRLCTVTCASNRLADSARAGATTPADARLAKYRAALIPHR